MFPERYHGYTGEEVGDLCPEQHWPSWDSQVQRAVQGDEGVSPSTLSTILRELAERNIIGKRIFAEVPPRVEYSLTETGMELRQSIIPLLRWAAKYDTETRPNDCCDNNQYISII